MRNTHTPKNRGRASASLGAAIADLTDGYGRFNAPGTDPDKGGDALIAQTYGPPLEALENWNAPATSVHEAAAALCLVDNELRVNAAPSLCPPMVSAALRFIDPLDVSPELQAHIGARKDADDDQDAADEAYHRLKEEFFRRRKWSMEADQEFSAQPNVAALSKRSDAAVERGDACLLAAMRTPCLGLGDVAAKLSVAKLWLRDDDQGELYANENQALLASMLPLFDVSGAEETASPAAWQDSADEEADLGLPLEDDVYDQLRSVKAMMFFLVRELQDASHSVEMDRTRDSIEACHTVGRHCAGMLDALLERIDEGAGDGRQTAAQPRSEVRNVW